MREINDWIRRQTRSRAGRRVRRHARAVAVSDDPDRLDDSARRPPSVRRRLPPHGRRDPAALSVRRGRAGRRHKVHEPGTAAQHGVSCGERRCVCRIPCFSVECFLQDTRRSCIHRFAADGRCRRMPPGRAARRAAHQGHHADGPALRDGHRADKRLVPDLTKEDFEVYDNGKLQTHHQLRQQATPITVVVMLDTSGSMTLALDLVKHARRAVPDPPAARRQGHGRRVQRQDRVPPAPRSPNNRDQLVARAQGSRLRLSDAACRTRWTRASTQLKESTGARRCWCSPTATTTRARRVAASVIERARTEEVMIYAIGLESEYFNGQQQVRTRPDRGLRRLAEETGGGYFQLKKTDELGADVHARRAGTAQPVRARLLARDARRQDPQARSAGQEAGCHPPLAQELCGEPSDGHGHGEVTFVWQLNFSCQGSV